MFTVKLSVLFAFSFGLALAPPPVKRTTVHQQQSAVRPDRPVRQ